MTTQYKEEINYDNICSSNVTIRGNEKRNHDEITIRQARNDKHKERELCSICYEKISRKINTTTTSCGHCFHSSCLFKCVAKNIEKCPLCKKHLFKKELTMRQLYEDMKDEIFNFDSFCYMMNMLDSESIAKCITDYDKYEDHIFSDDDSDDEEEESNGLFSVNKFEKKLIDKITDFLENE
jgi:hypothetical protein